MTHDSFKLLLLDLLRQAHLNQNAFFQQLPAAELAAEGTPELWSAKDHVAHMTFWRERLTLSLQAIIRNEPQPEGQRFELLNPLIFQEHRADPWAAILAESDRAYAELIEVAAWLSEDELTARVRFEWAGDGMPLYTAFMGNCYEHTQNHLAQYLLDRRDGARALAIQEAWADRVIEANVPDLLKGYVLYNLACFYATHEQVEKARPALRRAFALYPAVRLFAMTDPDLEALRSDFAE